MSQYAIQCEGLGKRYRLAGRQRYRSLRESVLSAIRSPFRGRPSPSFLWALADVNLNVEHGEVLGVIGPNGAGKSTMLKILSRITRPTAGHARLAGCVGSLLEVGTGFHPELTGRENVYLDGAILGMRRRDIARRFDEIVDFSGCEAFIDAPVKHYSSGMQMRLAFAVAAHLNTDILLVDEVLAVGDAEFQKKCLGKMNDVARSGRTVLFVSHNMLAVQAFCGRAVCLQKGRIVDDGRTSTVVANYLKSTIVSSTDVTYDDPASAPGNDTIRLRRVTVRPEFGSAADPITLRTPVVMEFEYWNLVPEARVALSLDLFNQQGVLVFSTADVNNIALPAGLIRSQVTVPGDFLNHGMYRVGLSAVLNQGVLLYQQEDALTFEVLDCIDHRGAWYGDWPGAVRPQLLWRTAPIGQVKTETFVVANPRPQSD